MELSHEFLLLYFENIPPLSMAWLTTSMFVTKLLFGDLLFNHLLSPNFYSFKVVICYYFLINMHALVSFYQSRPQSYHPQSLLLVKWCFPGYQAPYAFSKPCLSNPNSFVLTSLEDVYSKYWHVCSACQLFDKITSNVEVCN